MAVAGLSSRSADLASKINCSKILNKEEENFFITIEIQDKSISKQRFLDRIPARKGQTLLELLENYSSENLKTFSFETEETPFGHKIKSINGIGSFGEAHLVWQSWTEENGKTVEEVVDLASEKVSQKFGYIFQYG